MLTAIFAILASVFLLLWLNGRGRRLLAERDHLRALHEADELLAKLAAEAATSQKRFDLIDGIIAERDQALSMYHGFARGSAAAQSWLLRELEKVHRALNAERKAAGKEPVLLSPKLHECVKVLSDTADAVSAGRPAEEIREEARGSHAQRERQAALVAGPPERLPG